MVYVDQLGRFNLSVSGNYSSMEPFKWRGSYDKCRNKVVKGEGIFCGNCLVGRGKYPPCQMVGCKGCYV